MAKHYTTGYRLGLCILFSALWAGEFSFAIVKTSKPGTAASVSDRSVQGKRAKFVVPSGPERVNKEVHQLTAKSHSETSLKAYNSIGLQGFRRHSIALSSGPSYTFNSLDLKGQKAFGSGANIANEKDFTELGANLEVGYSYLLSRNWRVDADLAFSRSFDADDSDGAVQPLKLDSRVRGLGFLGARVFRWGQVDFFTLAGMGYQAFLNQSSLKGAPGVALKLDVEWKSLSFQLMPTYFVHAIQSGPDIRDFSVESGSQLTQLGFELGLAWRWSI